jgi:hypothetical protein
MVQPPAPSSDSDRWLADYEKFRHSRLERVQGSAQQWLGTITALLGLFSAAIVISSSAVSGLSDGWRHFVFVSAVLLYVVVLLGVGFGAWATFGGLGLRRLTDKELVRYIELEEKRSTSAAEAAAFYQASADAVEVANSAAPLELATAAGDKARIHREHVALARERRAQQGPDQSWIRRAGPRLLGLFWPTPPPGDSFDYRFHYENQADARRARLHVSRLFGVMAAVFAGVLAMVILGLQTLSSPSPSMSLLVVHNGTVTCETTHPSKSGQTIFSGPTTGVVQVTVVSHC